MSKNRKNTPFILLRNAIPILSGMGGTVLETAFFTVLFSTVTVVSAQNAHKLLRQGDKSYASNDYKQAEENYTKAQQAQRSSKGDYNLGNTIYQQQRYDDALKQYEGVIAQTQDNKLKFNSLYNKGNSHFAKKEYDKAVDSYKNALRMNPTDTDTKTNLAIAQRMLQQQQQQQNKDKQNQDKNKSNDDKDKQNKNPQNQNQQDQNQQNKDKNQQNQNQQQPQQNSQQNPNQTPQQDMKRDQARQILQIMDDEERKVQQRLRKGKPKPSRSSKDW